MSWLEEKAAAEIGEGQWIVAATPSAQAAYAKASQGHAPTALCLEPWGALRLGEEVAWLGTANEALGLLAQGRVDVAFVEAPQTMEEIESVPKRVNGPCLLNVVRGGKTVSSQF